MSRLVLHDLGRASYRSALDLQHDLLADVQNGSPDQLILVEHDPPVITLGRREAASHILASPKQLEAAGVEVHQTSRGGDVTWHGPGQLVAYPIVRLNIRRRTVHQHVNNLEEAIIRLLEQFDIAAARREGFPGVWVGCEKIASIGVAVSRWVAYHGLAINVSDDLTGFDLIVPCGLADAAITSISKQLGHPVTIGQIKKPFVRALNKALVRL